MRLRNKTGTLSVELEAVGWIDSADLEVLKEMGAHGLIRYSLVTHLLDATHVWESMGYTRAQQRRMNDWMLTDGAPRQFAYMAGTSGLKPKLMISLENLCTTACWVGGAPRFHRRNAITLSRKLSRMYELVHMQRMRVNA